MNRRIFYLDPEARKPNAVRLHRRLIEQGLGQDGPLESSDVVLCDWSRYHHFRELRLARGLGFGLCHVPEVSERLHHKKLLARTLAGRPYMLETYLGKAPWRLRGLWAEKPYNLDRGEGISFVRAPRQWRKKHHLLQRNLDEPWLIGGRKTDVRMLARIDDDGTIRVHPEARVRVAHLPYDLASDDPLVHNANPMFLERAGITQPEEHLFSEVTPHPEALEAMVAIIEDTAAILRAKDVFGDTDDFELLGYDLILDRHGRPHLLEVNRSPGFHDSSEIHARFYLGALQSLFGER